MQGLHNNSLPGDGLRPVTICPTSRHNVVLIPPWSQSWKKGAQHWAKRFMRAKQRAQHSYQQVKEIIPSNNPASSISAVKSSMVLRLGVFFLIHVSVVIEIGITDQRNWMQESAKADVIFVASWPLRSQAYSIPFALWSVESPQTQPEKVVLGELVQERS